jgi:hypothetical protein
MTLHTGAARKRDQPGRPELSIGQVMEGQEDANSRRVMPIVPDWVPRTPLDYLLPHLSFLLYFSITALYNAGSIALTNSVDMRDRQVAAIRFYIVIVD